MPILNSGAGIASPVSLDGYPPSPIASADLVGMVPPALPNPELLVTLTGILEFAGAVGVLIPATAPVAAACLIALMIAMFPANVSAARREVAGGDPLGRRTATQLVFIAAAALIIV